MRTIKIDRHAGDYVCLAINTGNRNTRIFLTEDQAQHLSNRLQSFANGGYGSELIAVENEI